MVANKTQAHGGGRVVLENKWATLWYHPAEKIVHHEIHEPIVGKPFRELLTKGAELFEERHADKWLSDDRGNTALHPDDSKWAIEEWSPRVIKAGWKYWAIVMPDAALGKLNMKRFIVMYRDLGVEVDVFGSPDEALAWLKSR